MDFKVCIIAFYALAFICTAVCSPECPYAKTFCNSNDQCKDLNYLALITPSPVSLPRSTNSFSVVMASDIEPYYLNCQDVPHRTCIHFLSRKPAVLDAAILEQVKCIKAFASNASNNVKAIFDGGDLTNSRLNSELNVYKNLFYNPLATTGLPRYLNLGNHDYYSAINARGPSRMISFLAESLKNIEKENHTISSIDIYTDEVIDHSGSSPQTVQYMKGSLGYTVDIEGFVFVFMHWATALTNTGIYTDQYEVTLESGIKQIFDITDIQPYLYSIFSDLNNNGKKFILVPHSIRSITKFICSYADPEMIDLFNNKVVAILSGHDHDQWGFYGNYNVYKNAVTENCPASGTTSTSFSLDGSAPGIPVFYTGSATYQTLVKANFDFSSTTPVQVDAYTTDPKYTNACLDPIKRNTFPRF